MGLSMILQGESRVLGFKLGLPDPSWSLITCSLSPGCRICLLKPELAVSAKPRRERKGAQWSRAWGWLLRATELFSPGFLHYNGIPYVHSSFLTILLTLACPSGSAGFRECFLTCHGGYNVLMALMAPDAEGPKSSLPASLVPGASQSSPGASIDQIKVNLTRSAWKLTFIHCIHSLFFYSAGRQPPACHGMLSHDIQKLYVRNSFFSGQ